MRTTPIIVKGEPVRRFALSALIALAAVAGGAAAAQRGREPDSASLAAAKQEAAEAMLRSRRLEEEAGRATSAAARARAEAEALAARIEAGEADITGAEARIRIIEALARQQRARLAERQAPLVRLTAALHTITRRPPAMALIQPGSVDDVVHVRSVLAATLPVIRRRTAALRAEVERGNQLRSHALVAHRALVGSREELRRRRIALARFEAQQRQRSESLVESAVVESDRALAFGEEARELARLIGTRDYQERLGASLAALSGPLARPGSERESADSSPRPDYRLPVEGRLLTGVGEISDAGVHARGLTFETEPNAPVLAPGGGRVAFAGPFRGYGQVLIIDHGRGWYSVLTGLGTLAVRDGLRVGRGQPVGRAGEGTPVSVELRHRGRAVAIAPLLTG